MELELLEILIAVITAVSIGCGALIVSKIIKSIPFPLILFVTGIVFASLNLEVFEPIRLTTDSVMFIYLPILLFESAVHFDFSVFKRILVPGFLLASVGLLISALILVIPLTMIFEIPFLEALLYASVISSTDPIAVLSIFKSLGVPKRLQFLVDGESFLNDATSIIMYKIVLAFIAGGAVTLNQFTSQLTASEGLANILEFMYLIIGGTIVGVSMGWLFSEIISFIKNIFVIEISLSFILATGIFIIAEEILKVSGIIAVLAAGIVLGNYGRNKISPSSVKIFNQTWEQIGFVTTSIVFILIGYEINFAFISSNSKLIIISTLFLLIGRSVAVYLIGGIYNKFTAKQDKIPLSWLTITNIGGIRGVLPLIIILSLDPNLVTFKEAFLQMVLAAILTTLTINTLLITPLIKRWHINKLTFTEEIEKKLINTIFCKKMVTNLDYLKECGEISTEVFDLHKRELESKLKSNIENLFSGVMENNESGSAELQRILKLYFLQIEKATYKTLYKKQIIDLNLYERLAQSLLVQRENVIKDIEQMRSNRTDVIAKFSKLKKVNFSILSIFRRFWSGSNHQIVADTYLYYKSRLMGDEEVLKEINTTFVLENKLINEEIVGKIRSIYDRLYKENKETLSYIRQEYSAIADEVEEGIYSKELASLKYKIAKDFGEDERISEKPLSQLSV